MVFDGLLCLVCFLLIVILFPSLVSLNYVLVLKKSQKEASNLVQRVKETDTHDQGNCSISSKLASDLTSQWKSLFLHMGDIFVHESNQLVSATFISYGL